MKNYNVLLFYKKWSLILFDSPGQFSQPDPFHNMEICASNGG